MRHFFSPLPDPQDRSPAPLRPHKKHPGNYRLHREFMETEVTWEEPDGTTYQLAFFECETLMKRVLGLEEQDVNTILDRLWNFHRIEFDPDNPEIVRPLRDEERV